MDSLIKGVLTHYANAPFALIVYFNNPPVELHIHFQAVPILLIKGHSVIANILAE